MYLWSNDNISDSFIVLKVLYESENPQSTTQISQKISSQSDGKLFKVPGVLRHIGEQIAQIGVCGWRRYC